MVNHGGLLTEFMTLTNADKPNFVRRNRIVAGMADSVILVESAAKGGGLITAEIAQSYARSVFAFPGHVFAEFSEGFPIGKLTSLLFQLEMKGVVKPLAGGMYHLLS
ncbi:MAG: hypothetical protein E7103_00910 [Prevotella sp.]|nr:hypothetical protein [Prevotella sp.]